MKKLKEKMLGTQQKLGGKLEMTKLGLMALAISLALAMVFSVVGSPMAAVTEESDAWEAGDTPGRVPAAERVEPIPLPPRPPIDELPIEAEFEEVVMKIAGDYVRIVEKIVEEFEEVEDFLKMNEDRTLTLRMPEQAIREIGRDIYAQLQAAIAVINEAVAVANEKVSAGYLKDEDSGDAPCHLETIPDVEAEAGTPEEEYRECRWERWERGDRKTQEFLREQGLDHLLPRYVPGQILVRWKDGVNEATIESRHAKRGTSVIRTFYATHRRERTIQVVRLREGQTVREALREYLRDPLVAHAQPNYLYHIPPAADIPIYLLLICLPPHCHLEWLDRSLICYPPWRESVVYLPYYVDAQPHYGLRLPTELPADGRRYPDDPFFELLWGLHNVDDADIDAPEAWTLTTGSADIVVAVIDTGVNYNHPELSGNMWRNPDEILDGIDNDGNGFVDDIYGWDFFDNDNSPMDFDGHGTHVAGTIAATGNNTVGITGVMWDAQIMALKISGVDAFLSPLCAIAPAVNYAVANGAHIINASWGAYRRRGALDASDYILRDAIEAAGEAGVLFVAAAGNTRRNNDGPWAFFPASFSLPNIISVAASDQNDNLAEFSNYGPNSVHVAAPGVSIFSTIHTFNYGPREILYDSAGFDGDEAGDLPYRWVNRGPNNTWAVTCTHYLSHPHSFADSPGANYANNLIATETLTYLDKRIAYTHKDSRYRFIFDMRYDLFPGDNITLVVSPDGERWWQRRRRDVRTGSTYGEFVAVVFDATWGVEHFRQTGAYFGFGINSDFIFTGEGVYVDNLTLIRKPILIDDPAYTFLPGTSMAAPHVAGLAGLLLSLDPTLTVAELRGLILSGVDIIDGLEEKLVTGGRINAYTSLTLTLPVFQDDFDDGNLLNPTWSADDADDAGVTEPVNFDSPAMFLRGDGWWQPDVSVTSPVIDLSALTSAKLSVWIRRGCDTFSENPNAGENLRIEYRNNAGSWVVLATFPGAGTPGQIFTPSYVLPTDALHSGLRIRFVHPGGWENRDYWHVDDVVVSGDYLVVGEGGG